MKRISWPEGRAFAFSIFDDPDSQTFEAGKEIYAFLKDRGFRTTKGVWPSKPVRTPSDCGITCEDNPEYIAWLQRLQTAGFEIGLHNVTSHTSDREEIRRGLDQFSAYFGHDPKSMANHYFCEDALYWGENRVTGTNRFLYNAFTLGRKRNISHGHEPGHPYFWGDLCKERIKYARNFAFASLNTLQACPVMPYYDPLRPYVNYWFASSEGSNVDSFQQRVTERNIDLLEREGGACIMYVHFGHRFFSGRALDPRFRLTMERLAQRKGWFVPVSTLLDFLLGQKSTAELSDRDRASLERRWLLHKVRFGTA
ncbi:MAG TPA: hypothetical protein VMI06_09235 [Terriglobia bacterium]|nr:hypothetical protein [Terriglobia bacterium]